MIAMGAAERNVFIRAHLAPPIEIVPFEIHIAVVWSVIIFEAAIGIGDSKYLQDVRERTIRYVRWI